MRKRDVFLIFITAIVVSFLTTLYFEHQNKPALATPQQKEISAPAAKISNIVDLQKQIVDISENAKKSVAFIKVVKTDKRAQYKNPLFDQFGRDDFFREFFGDKFRGAPRYNPKTESVGTGFVIDDKSGFIVTNNHVIADADVIDVTLNNRTMSAKLVGTDPQTDIGLIKLEKFDSANIRKLDFADSDKILPGQFSIAVGSPFGLTQSVTFGIISAKGRSNMNISEYEDFIQTDAAINPGNSGGPLLNISGQVIGMNTAIFSKSGGYMGIGFAVPANMIKTVVSQLKDGHEVRRSQLGVAIQELNQELKKHLGLGENTNGVLIVSVFKDSPAEKAGLKEGDVVTEFDGKIIDSASKLRSTAAFTVPDKSVSLKAIRDGKELSFNISLSEKIASTENGVYVFKELGLAVLAENNLVTVNSVEENSIADYAGLRKGDNILEVNKKKITSFDVFVKTVEMSRSILILIDRNGQKFYAVINK